MVETGDQFWHVAQKTLTHAWDRQPSELAVATYWRRLLAQNRAELVTADNADFIYPGQVVELPDIAERS